jgi:hypothetical protein
VTWRLLVLVVTFQSGSCSLHLVFLILVVPHVLSATRVRFILRVSRPCLSVAYLILDSRTFVQIHEHPRALCLGFLFCLLAQRHSGASACPSGIILAHQFSRRVKLGYGPSDPIPHRLSLSATVL